MIYLTEGNIPLNAAYDDDIVQEANSTYQLTFKFPTNDILWQRLREEKFLTADDLHGEQDFVIFEVEKKHGYIQVYANQVMTMLNHYVVNPISLNRETGSTALSHFAGSITRSNPFSFFSDIEDRHTFNIGSKTAMEALTKDKHSIVGLWGGDLVRHGYQVRLLKNGGSENESLFMYKKNLSSYEQKTSTKSLRTRITFITTIRGEGEKAVDKHYKVVVDSPLINKYSQIYEDVVEVNDQDVVDEATLLKYGKQYFRTTLCDMLEDSIEIDVIGQSDVPVQMFDVVGVYHEYYDLDVRKKITKYNYSPMAKKLKSIGFGEFKSGLASAIGNVVSDAVKNETQHLEGKFEVKLAKEIQNADLAFDRKKEELTNQFTDEVNAIKAKAEEHKRALSDEIDRRFHDFSPEGFEEAKTKAEEALRKAGAIPDLQNMVQEIDRLQNEVGLKFYRLSNDFQSVKETAQLYERILGNTQNGIADNISRMVMTNQVFQTEVKKYVEDNSNLVFDPTNFSKWTKKQAEANVIEVQAGTRLLRITNNNYEQDVNHGFALPLTTSTFKWGDKLSYRIQAWVDVLPDAPLKIELTGQDGVIASDTVIFDRTGIQIITGTITVSKSTNKLKEYPLEISLTRNGQVAIGQVSLIRGETPPTEFKDDTSAQDVVIQTKMTQLSDFYAIQTLTGPGAISSQINLAPNDALIEANRIRLKGRTLADEITAIDGYFKRLFVGDARIGTLNTDIIRSNSIAADKLIFDTALARKLVASDVFTDTLAAKTAFINKLRSVVVSATFLEGYKGKIGGFQIGTHDKDPTTFWITGSNSFRVGMSDGGWRVKQTALWVNWGNNWDKPGNYAWFVNSDGEMHCYNKAQFWNVPRVHGNLEVTGDIFYFIDREKNKVGYWVHSPSYKRLEESNGYVYLYRQAGGYSWIPLNKEISDRRYKTNIQDSQVSGLSVIESLKTYSYRKEYDEKIEDISCGIMAQDVQKYAPEAFYENPDGAYSYNTFALVPYLIKAIQELNQKVERLETT
ncbi:phage tail spike protein [Streptococcus infantis]|uniref:phage tail spike protein n=1 Tax=Streptococcus infantis TaxID=68892 RepID=UPI0039C3CF4C